MDDTVHLSEPTVQQDETPQPPPPKPEEGKGEDGILLPELEQLKGESFFLTSCDPHPGQILLFSHEPTLCSSEKVVLQLLQTYS